MDEREFIERFEACTLPEDCFHHLDHVRLAWLYLSSQPLVQALESVTTGLKRFATAAGKPDRYHETISWAYMFLIHERMQRTGRGLAWGRFKEANADLLARDKGVLAKYYLPGTLSSDLARRVFVLPDRLAGKGGLPDS